MEIPITDYQRYQLNLIRRSNKRFKGLPLPQFICLVLDDWLDGGLYVL